MPTRVIEIIVGIFMLAGILALLTLALKVSEFNRIGYGDFYILKADFDNIGGLKEGAPVRISGVTVGHVSDIVLDPQTYRANVIMEIDNKTQNFPVDTTASIFTEGLLGANYISLSPGFEKEALKPGDNIQTTHSALILENLIGQLLFKSGSGSGGSSSSPSTTTTGSGGSTSNGSNLTSANNMEVKEKI